ncbi:UDP-2,4-diacetamido-2,4,6-trideoxy-beta-L-altropyranose hydrolase [Aquibacillus kalidii]|uniref:UDP-2,4-diacetamido-2,4, 6-trideoxy-beta-L-altropyranose hydrolase n=1 Tax=Aquibacillus kalidii TaxID=2762597 RepID=UPI001645899E|nr:UDP-2,4-diacetamido-2,4,6-trideoxy-beta-L-altropyranose hydrolase [Aquibacillus kalidii]
MIVIIRVDSSNSIGTGHVYRCVTLAEQLRNYKVKVLFICMNLEGNSINYIKNNGFEIRIIKSLNNNGMFLYYDDLMDIKETCKILTEYQNDNTCLIVDHYNIDISLELQVSPYINKILVIDDLANRKHCCDLLLDQTFNEDGEKYKGLINDSCKKLLGLNYALVREQFRRYRKKKFFLDNKKIKIHVFFGGTDNNNFTFKYSDLILQNFDNTSIIAIVGAGFKFTEELISLEKKYSGRFYWKQNITNMAKTMASCDIAIGAPGSTTWERACIGLPAAYFSIVDNQVNILKKMELDHFCTYLGDARKTTEQEFTNKFSQFINNKKALKKYFMINTIYLDGNGANRVAKSIEMLLKE